MSNKDRVSIAASDHDHGGSQVAEAPNIDECDSNTRDVVDANSPSTHGVPTDLQGATRPSGAAPTCSHVDDPSDSDSSDDDAPRTFPNPPPTRGAKKKKVRRNFGVFPAFAGFPGYNPDDYEQKYSFDNDVSEAMGPNARVWRVYLDEAKAFDDDMIEGWRYTIDVLLVFAGLFSAVVTTLVVQASQSLQPNYAQISVSLLVELVDIQRAVALGLSRDVISQSSQNLTTMVFDAGSSDKWVNGLWFVSLALSLATALISMLVKQWFQYYISSISGSVQQKAHTHQFRFAGLQKWHVSTIVGCLPIMMHLALLLFFAGLVVYV